MCVNLCMILSGATMSRESIDEINTLLRDFRTWNLMTSASTESVLYLALVDSSRPPMTN